MLSLVQTTTFQVSPLDSGQMIPVGLAFIRTPGVSTRAETVPDGRPSPASP